MSSDREKAQLVEDSLRLDLCDLRQRVLRESAFGDVSWDIGGSVIASVRFRVLRLGWVSGEMRIDLRYGGREITTFAPMTATKPYLG